MTRLLNAIRYNIALLAIVPAALSASQLFGPANPEAPEGIEQYGRFVGTWTCASQFRNPEGEWQKAPSKPTWRWHYALNGHAVQDVWIPDPENSPPGAAMGTNLRVYDKENDTWDMVWTTETTGNFQHFAAQQIDGNMVMTADVPAGNRPAHMARITFYNISERHFDWKYEASAPGDGVNWMEYSRLSCDRE